MALFAEGFVKYPEELPCPQVDTDLKPRERRYISDIGEVKRLRRFQSTFQAERQKISFIFTREQAAEFKRWYKEDIIEGGAWFYADWPILHKDKSISYRFVTRPVWEFLARGVYHVTASVETYERKVGAYEKQFPNPDDPTDPDIVFTSKIYPYYFNDSISQGVVTVKGSPYAALNESISIAGKIVTSGAIEKYIFSSYAMKQENIELSGKTITAGTTSSDPFIYSKYIMSDESIMCDGKVITDGFIERTGYLRYGYFSDALSLQGKVITSGEIE